MDERLLAKQDAERDQGVAAVVMVLLDTIVGGWISHSAAGMAAAMWIAAVPKVGVVVAWVCFKGRMRMRSDTDTEPMDQLMKHTCLQSSS